MTRVFISSVQKEFASERKALCKYIREDALLCKFFEPFIFEELPATLDQLTKLHNSQPANPILAHPVYFAGYIERIGTGTTDIVEKCIEAGLPSPVYQQDGGFKVIIWRREMTTNEPQKTSVTKIQLRYRILMESIISNPYITREELAEVLDVGLATVKRDINALRRGSYRIEWIGSSKSGRWEI